MTTSLAIVIPAYNEAESLPALIAEIRESGGEIGIVVVDDCSDDDTPDLLPALDVRWLRLHERLGIGPAVRTGLRYAHRLGYETIVRLDADGQHRPAEIPRVLAPIVGGHADAVQGSRYTGATGYQSRGALRLGQRGLAALLSRMMRRRVTDPTSGFWGFGPRAVRLLAEHHPSGYPEPELLLLLHRNGLRVDEVPIDMRPRRAGRTSLTPPRAALALASVLVTATVAPLRSRVEVTAP